MLMKCDNRAVYPTYLHILHTDLKKNTVHSTAEYIEFRMCYLQC
jgi:hypothetical protein